MADVFLSYCATDPDQNLAKQIAATLTAQGVDVFMAAISLQPGYKWSETIQKEMGAAGRVIFLASAKASQSPYVQQELGGAHFGSKVIIPFVWDMEPANLPGFIAQYQAVDLRQREDVLMETLRRVSNDIVSERRNGILALAAIAALIWYTSRP